MTDHPDTDLNDPHGEAETLRKENARLRAEIAEATDPEFIWGALDNVHDCDTTLDDYAAAVSRAQRAALAASRAPDPAVNVGSCQAGDLNETKTLRGFSKVEFEDHYGVSCSIQKSSLATDDAIWIGANDLGLKRFPGNYTGWHDVDLTDVFPGQTFIANTRMHLTRDQVLEILPTLRHFVETGEVRAIPAAQVAEAQPTIGGAELDALEDMRTHRRAWREAIVQMKSQADDGSDAADAAYWAHELTAFDRTFFAITALRAQPDWRAMAVWHSTKERLPQKPGKRSYEQVECLIAMSNGDIELSMWNCEHLCWDDAEGDDFRHSPTAPVYWLDMAPLRAALSDLAKMKGE